MYFRELRHNGTHPPDTYQSFHESAQFLGHHGELEEGSSNIRFILGEGHTSQSLQRPDQTHFIVDMCYRWRQGGRIKTNDLKCGQMFPGYSTRATLERSGVSTIDNDDKDPLYSLIPELWIAFTAFFSFVNPSRSNSRVCRRREGKRKKSLRSY